MADFGLTDNGFILKRLNDIVTEGRSKAVTLFQDLVAVSDVIDTSSSSILGRLIALYAAGDSVLWEQLQEVYNAFDPNTATGIALDNLVAYAGLTRQDATYSTAQGLFTGDVGTLIDAGLTVRGTTTGEDFSVRSSVTINAQSASGIGVQALVVADNTLYTISYATSTTTSTISYTSGVGATQASIQAGIAAVVASTHSSLKTSIVNNILYIDRVAVYDVVNWSSSANIGILKARKVGSLIATDAGPVEGEANTLTQILVPKTGWDSVTNPSAVVQGSNQETDSELRERFRQSKYIRATNILEALYSDLISLDNVQEVQIYENDTDQVDINGVPAHSFLPIILGGDPLQIAESIWENKPLGIRSYGNTTQTIYDSQGFPHDIGFERPNPVAIYINLNITADTNFPQNGTDLIKQNLIDYFDENFGIGDDVVYSRLYTPINAVPGHFVTSLTLGTLANPTGTSNIDIAFNQIASLSSSNINITVN